MSNSLQPAWRISGIRPCAGPGDSCRFVVTLERGADGVHDLKLEAAELVEYQAFQAQVLKSSGRLIRFAEVERSGQPVAAWLDLVETALDRESAKKAAPGFRPSPPPPRYHMQDGAAQEMTEIGGGD